MDKVKRILQQPRISATILLAITVATLSIVAAPTLTTSKSNRADINTSIIRVSAIGDSNTQGIVEEPNINSYPSQLQTLLGAKYKVFNYGVGGRTLLSTGDFPYAMDAAYAQSNNTNPNIVLIMLGTNDSKPQNWNATTYEKELETFVNGYQQLSSKPKVYLLTVPAAYSNSVGIRNEIISDEVVPIIKKVAVVTDTPLIDINSVTKNRSQLFPDGIHMSAAGYNRIAQTVYDAIKR